MTALLARLTARRDPPRDLLAESARRQQHAETIAYHLRPYGGRDRLLPPPRWPDPYVFGPQDAPGGIPGMWPDVRCHACQTGWRGDEPCWACPPEVLGLWPHAR